ncbi:VENN motif pre-toxin domain-containing protein, partial [Enterobacter sp. 186315]
VNILAHAILGGAVAAMQGNSVAAGAAGAGVGELAAHGIMATLYPGKEASDLGEDDRQLISTLATISAGMAGGLAGNGTSSAAAGAQAGRNAVENNALSFGSGMDSYVNAAASWNQYAAANGLTSEETQAGLDKLAKGDLPDGANITKAIVDGYQDGVMIAGAWYLGPAASVGKVVAGGAIAEGANGYFQWENLNKPGNENESWNYRSSAAAFASGMLAPGRYIPANIAIGMGGAWFSDGLNGASQAGAALGGLAGGAFGTFAPMGVGKIIGKDLPGFAYDIGGAYIFEYGNDATKDLIKKFGDN